MTAPTACSEVDRYLDGVRDALADLDAGDRDDLLEDLQGHLEELRAEDPVLDLEQRLGEPARYAEELRLSAGLPPRDAESGISLSDRLARTKVALGNLVSSWPGGKPALEFLGELQPAWWVLRAYGVVAVVNWLAHGNSGYSWDRSVVPVIHGTRLFGALVLLTVVVASVRLGRIRTTLSASRRIGLGLLNVVLLVGTVAYVRDVGHSSYEQVTVAPCCGTLFGSNGQPVSNVYAYDQDGRPLSQVQLFDQDGQPIDITVNDESGREALHNVFPQRQVLSTVPNPDGTYQEVPRPAPSFAVPRLAPSPSPSAAPTPTPSRAGPR